MTGPNRNYRKGISRTGIALVLVLSALTLSFSDARMNPPSTHLEGSWALMDNSGIEKYAVVQVQPAYPVAAQKYRIQGTVTVQVVIKDDQVVKAEFVRGNSVFRSVSLDAAKQWRFRLPDSGKGAGTIDFTFKLDR